MSISRWVGWPLERLNQSLIAILLQHTAMIQIGTTYAMCSMATLYLQIQTPVWSSYVLTSVTPSLGTSPCPVIRSSRNLPFCSPRGVRLIFSTLNSVCFWGVLKLSCYTPGCNSGDIGVMRTIFVQCFSFPRVSSSAFFIGTGADWVVWWKFSFE